MSDKNIRVGKNFNEQIKDIKKERLNRKIDKEKISSSKITSLIPKHKDWKQVKEDIIENKTIRVDPTFQSEIEDIKKKRVENKMDRKRVSNRTITSLIPKHNFWKRMKEDIINFKFNKKGTATANIFLFIILAFIAIILIGTFLYTYNIITESLLTSDVKMVGQVNLSNATGSTLGQINTAMLSKANVVSIFFLFGMVFALIFVAYITRDENPAIFFVIDVLVIIFAYILAVYISNSYETVLSSLPFSSIFTTNLNYATSFLLLLPKITLIMGIIIMFVSYAAIPKTKEEEVAGY